MICCSTQDILLHRTGETKIYYYDLGEAIKGRTITVVSGITADDALLTLSTISIISTETSDYDQQGNALTIEANTGIKWTMGAGTAGIEDDEYTATLTFTFTTSAGTEQATLRVKVL
jgi:hypothetical protein